MFDAFHKERRALTKKLSLGFPFPPSSRLLLNRIFENRMKMKKSSSELVRHNFLFSYSVETNTQLY